MAKEREATVKAVYCGSDHRGSVAMLTPKQESFAQKYVELGNASEAYRQSYDAENMADKTVWEEASLLLDNPKVAPRVAELRAAHRERHNVTVDSITQELEEARSLAKLKEQTASMVSASMGKAKLHGLIEDKTNLSGEMSVKVTREFITTTLPVS